MEDQVSVWADILSDMMNFQVTSESRLHIIIDKDFNIRWARQFLTLSYPWLEPKLVVVHNQRSNMYTQLQTHTHTRTVTYNLR